MTDGPPPVPAERETMVVTQIERRGIKDPRVLAAMRNVPREAFVGLASREFAYADVALPIEAGQTISQPYIVARMTELLASSSGDRILEIGTGSGYQAAVLAAMGCRVTTIERQPELAEQARATLDAAGFGHAVEVLVGDGSVGYAVGAPWDGILVTAAAPSIAIELREQLGEGRRLVIPVGPRDHQELMVVTRHGNEWTDRSDGPCVFVPLVGEGGWES